ncbi:hypothetical protein ACFOLF_20950 [Paenibacillus sepulcri]|uniref:hypothetical protein n=1 Tax=Paenibacillus sepulcri TaxID=359917 RepID=UPI0035EF7026
MNKPSRLKNKTTFYYHNLRKRMKVMIKLNLNKKLILFYTIKDSTIKKIIITVILKLKINKKLIVFYTIKGSTIKKIIIFDIFVGTGIYYLLKIVISSTIIATIGSLIGTEGAKKLNFVDVRKEAVITL